MYCSKCGQAVSDEDRFCSNCGNQISLSTKESAQWEYKDFNLKWSKGIFGEAVSVAEIAYTYWQENQKFILDKLSDEMKHGWEPISSIGPQCFHIEEKRGLLGWYNQAKQIGTRDIYAEFILKLRKPVSSSLTDFIAPRNTLVDVVLIGCGPRNIEVIKSLRVLFKLNLSEAVEISKTPNVILIKGIAFNDAKKVKDELEMLGASVGLINSK